MLTSTGILLMSSIFTLALLFFKKKIKYDCYLLNLVTEISERVFVAAQHGRVCWCAVL